MSKQREWQKKCENKGVALNVASLPKPPTVKDKLSPHVVETVQKNTQ